ncbi:transposase family protein [Arthrobacter wenxiniae]|jgi:hypothetical protein|uniref:Transposase family protein n=2 Tax=Arthrobacter TaxID=1663 RepID=A0A7Y7IJS0_9MICC|nr:transposase family protein [Arthrobacter wenxiniae]NVM96753.1 transposase family protein [Arthrobacter wenxiniae]
MTAVAQAATGLIVHGQTAQGLTGCPACGVAAVGHRRRRVRLHDIPCCGGPVRLVRAKRLWQCRVGLCPTTVVSEQHSLAGKRAILTNRAIRWATDAVEKCDASVSALSHQLGVSWRVLLKGIETEGRRRVGRL